MTKTLPKGFGLSLPSNKKKVASIVGTWSFPGLHVWCVCSITDVLPGEVLWLTEKSLRSELKQEAVAFVRKSLKVEMETRPIQSTGRSFNVPRVLCGGPARERQSEVFALHREGLLAQSRSSLTADAANLISFHVEVRHNSVPDNEGPRWNHAKIARVAKVRQAFLNDAFFYQGSDQTRMNYAGVFMVDTDVIVGPGVLARMWSVEADVVYGVFWTEADWLDGSRICPQVWNVHPYQFTDQVWEALNMPGVHEIDVLGGGACTLIRGRGFESAYWPLLESLKYSGGMWAGEDRTFCLGLETRGIRQVAVTGLPIAHCYTDELKRNEWLKVVRREVGL